MENKNTNSTWKKKVILFLASQYISLFGSSLVQMAMIWYVTLQTSSGVWVTVLTVCSFIPQMIISFCWCMGRLLQSKGTHNCIRFNNCYIYISSNSIYDVIKWHNK